MGNIKNKYTIEKLNEETMRKRIQNIDFLKDEIDKIHIDRIEFDNGGPKVERLKCVRRGETAYRCLKCGLVYHGEGACPSCDEEAVVNFKWGTFGDTGSSTTKVWSLNSGPPEL